MAKRTDEKLYAFIYKNLSCQDSNYNIGFEIFLKTIYDRNKSSIGKSFDAWRELIKKTTY